MNTWHYVSAGFQFPLISGSRNDITVGGKYLNAGDSGEISVIGDDLNNAMVLH